MLQLKRTYGEMPDQIPEGMSAKIHFPALVALDSPTDAQDRTIAEEGFSSRELPLSVMYQTRQKPGHEGAEISGRLDRVQVWEDDTTGAKFASGDGFALDDEAGRRMVGLIKNQALRGNSVDLSVAAADVDAQLDENLAKRGIFSMSYRFNKAALMATTVVPKPAFGGATVTVTEERGNAGLGLSFSEEQVDDFGGELVACFVGTSTTITRPKAEWFTNPKLARLTPLTVTEDHRVFGHVADWRTPHLTDPRRLTAPRSRTDYAYYATQSVLTDGGMVPTGQLVIGGNHADPSLAWREALDVYANTTAAWADVAIGEDSHGIWVAGCVRPGTSPETVYAARASKVSGHWCHIGGGRELIALLSVNTPGFPVPRTYSEGGIELGAIGVAYDIADGGAVDPSFASDVAYLAQRARNDERRELLDVLTDL